MILRPLDPSTEQARDWLTRELATGGYDVQPSLGERFREWLATLLASFGGGAGAAAWMVPVVVLLVLAVLAVVAFRVVRRDPAGVREQQSRGVLDDVSATARELREQAEEALSRADHEAALVAAYRAIVAGAVERTIIDNRPGRTAHEAAHALSPAFPSEREALLGAADAFDAVRFGGRSTDAATARAVIALHDTLARTRPELTTVAAPW